MKSLIAAAVLCAAFAVTVEAQVVGFRGDGTGCYPNATPPTQWESATSLKGFMCQAAKPKDDQPAGKPLDDGIIREWLLLGPVDAPKEATGETEILKGEADFAPAAGEKVGELEWKAAPADGSLVPLAALFANKLDVAAWLHAYVYAPADATVAGNFIFGGRSVVWVNGKPVFKPADKDMEWVIRTIALPLKKGWNRLLVRTMPSNQYKTYGAFLYTTLRGDPKGPVEAKNVLWSQPLGGAAGPTVVGDRLFIQSEPYDLLCLDRNTGKVLWARSNNYYEATPEADRKAKPEFEEAGKLAAEINGLNDAWGKPEGLAKDQLAAKAAAEKKLYDLMKKIDETKYTFTKEQDLGMAGFVPVSDGKRVWAWYVSGIAACYDLDGNRKWIALDNRGGQHHGFGSSPALVDGKLVVYMWDLRCLDAETGKPLWVKPICKNPKDQWSHAFQGTPAGLNIGGVAMFVSGNGDIYRASDGEQVFGPVATGLQRPSAVVQGDTVFKLDNDGTLHVMKMPAEAADRIRPASHVKVKLDASAFVLSFGACWQASPVVHDGLVYCLHNSGLLSVVDAAKGEVVYQKLLDLDVTDGWGLIRPSLAVAGGKVFAMSATGTCVVFEPGREFKPVARNRVAGIAGLGQYWQRYERFAATPVFDGKRIYLRGETSLYCIGTR